MPTANTPMPVRARNQFGRMASGTASNSKACTTNRSSDFSSTMVPRVIPTGRPSRRINSILASSPRRITETSRFSIWLIIRMAKCVRQGTGSASGGYSHCQRSALAAAIRVTPISATATQGQEAAARARANISGRT